MSKFEKRFVPLHIHSDYSIGNSINTVNDLLEFGKKHHFQSMAITENANLSSAVKFYNSALEKYGIKPIIGMEIPCGHRNSLTTVFYPVLLAADDTGYKRLVQLSNKINSETNVHLDIEDDILSAPEGLILLCGGAMGIFASPILDDAEKYELAEKIKEIYKDNFYLEVFYQGLEIEKSYNRQAIAMGEKLEIDIVATNPGRYMNKNQLPGFETLLKLRDFDKNNYLLNGNFQLKTPDELEKLFKNKPEFLHNSYKIYKKLNFSMKFEKLYMPTYPVPSEYTSKTYLRKIVNDKLPPEVPGKIDPYIERAKSELTIIEKMNLSAYFLIIWDIVNFMKKKSFQNGPGRGSSCGSLIAYLLGIIEIDPIEHGLIFERFLNIERKGLPDIDVDVSHSHRMDVLNYISSMYDKDLVVQITSFGTFRAKASLREAARFLNYSGRDLDNLIKKIGSNDETLARAIPDKSDSRIGYLLNPQLIEVLKIAKSILGRIKNFSTHAAGIIIIPESIIPFVPLLTRNDNSLPVTAIDMKDLSAMGLVKFDILAVKTLTVIGDALRRAKRKISFRELELNFQEVYREIGQGNTFGIFQLESAGMSKFMKRLKPDNFKELIDGLALYRPGPMSSGMTDAYVNNNSDDFPKIVKSVLKNTRNVLIYQEQVMEIARIAGGLSMGRADLLREAMSKKKFYIIEKLESEFLEGAIKNGLTEDEAIRIFKILLKFGEYGFNKSHAAAYAELSYLTAYLKIKHPSHYISSLLNFEIGNLDKIENGINEAVRLGVKIKAPSINGPLTNFKSTKNTITFPVNAIKGIGQQHLSEIEDLRKRVKKFESIDQFLTECRRSRRLWESINLLLKSGALDCFGFTRRGLSLMIFDGQSIESISDIDEFPEEIIMSDEKELLGLYIPGRSMESYQFTVQYASLTSIINIDGLNNDEEKFMNYDSCRRWRRICG